MRIGIVGGGFCGTALATRLLRSAPEPIEVLLFEPRPKVGAGLAYSTQNPHHWLNVPSAKMSALPEDPHHFSEWLRVRGMASTTGFADRATYGAYLLDTLERTAVVSSGKLRHEQCSIVGMSDHGCLVADNGETYAVDQVVLAMGYLSGATRYAAETSPAFAPETWPETGVRNAIILGSGLSAVDVALTLIDRFVDVNITCISRHGWFPAPFLPGTTFPVTPPPDPRTPRTLLRWLRQEIGRAEVSGLSWVDVFDALRPQWEGLWQSLSERHRHQFVRHLMRRFDRFRHRMPPDTHALIQPHLDSGRVRVVSGQIERVTRTEVVLRSGRMSADLVVDATGPCFDDLASRSPLLARLHARGSIRAGSLGWGLRTDGSFRVAPGIYALGPILRGDRWETTAVPELREQVRAVADELLQVLARPHACGR